MRRNALCRCGSDKKYKKCCFFKDEGFTKDENGNWVKLKEKRSSYHNSTHIKING